MCARCTEDARRLAGVPEDRRAAATAAARRSAARRHHPDLGGSADELVASLRLLAAAGAGVPVSGAGGVRTSGAGGARTSGAAPGGPLGSARHQLSRAARRAGRTVTAVRAALPRAVPGSRRYARL